MNFSFKHKTAMNLSFKYKTASETTRKKLQTTGI